MKIDLRKKVKFDSKKIEENLLKWFMLASKEDLKEGLNWYYDALTECRKIAFQTKLPLLKVVKVMAILSPAVSWEQNIKDCLLMCENFTQDNNLDSFRVSTYGQNKLKAWLCLSDEIDLLPKSMKTFSFYRNMLLDNNHITVDRWILRAGVGSTDISLTPKRYKIFEAIIQKIASDCDLFGYQIQAVIWCSIRNWSNKND